MKYQCENCKAIFPHTAKLTSGPGTDQRFTGQVMIERSVCPFCTSLMVIEFVEPEADITSVKSVPLEEVDTYLKEGYVVRELYAKTATLVKQEAKQA